MSSKFLTQANNHPEISISVGDVECDGNTNITGNLSVGGTITLTDINCDNITATGDITCDNLTATGTVAGDIGNFNSGATKRRTRMNSEG